jgi:hydrogenase/urease accessory protein HupE
VYQQDVVRTSAFGLRNEKWPWPNLKPMHFGCVPFLENYRFKRVFSRVVGPRTPRGGTPSRLAVLLILVICVFVLCQPAYTHDVSQSESRIDIDDREVRVEFKMNLLELGYVDKKGTGFISYDELDDSIARIYSDIKQHYVLRAPELPDSIMLLSYRVIEDHVVDMELVYQFPEAVKQLSVSSTLADITQPSHQHLTSANLNGDTYEAILNRENPTATFAAQDKGALRTFRSFLRLGVTHIFTGYDHLAFLVGLLIVTSSLGSLLKIVTSFTVAHSITLALATLNIVVLPSRLTESVIAFSIAYVALENLSGKRTMERYRITFIFGLVHGFGFSNVLREMDLSRSHLALSLFSFNLGVELGQIAFVLVLFPLVLYIESSRWRRKTQVSVSLVVLSLAVYWFVRRAFAI